MHSPGFAAQRDSGIACENLAVWANVNNLQKLGCFIHACVLGTGFGVARLLLAYCTALQPF